MTSPIAPTTTETVATEPQSATTEVRENSESKEPVTLSEFIADALRAKKDQKSTAFQQQNKPNHHKTPNRPPHGTRRSMGKR